MTKAPVEPRPWLSGFCSAGDAEWQHAACVNAGAGHRRTPTKADPRDWVPCACPGHRPPCPEEPPMPATQCADDEFDGTALVQWAATPSSAGQITTGPPPLPVSVQILAAAADQFSAAATGKIEGLDWEDCIRLLDTLRTATHTLGQIDSLLVRQAYLKGPHGKNAAELDGIGLVSISRTADRKAWDERGVARAVIDAHMGDSDGTAPDPWEVAEWLLEVYGVNYCRVTPLRALGLEPAAFCEETTGKPTVSLPPRS